MLTEAQLLSDASEKMKEKSAKIVGSIGSKWSAGLLSNSFQILKRTTFAKKLSTSFRSQVYCNAIKRITNSKAKEGFTSLKRWSHACDKKIKAFKKVDSVYRHKLK